MLLILALSAFVVDRVRRLDERETTSRIMLLALVPTMLVIAQPDLGSGHRLRRRSPSRCCSWPAPSGPTSRRSARCAVTAIVIVLVAAPAAGVHVLKPYQEDRLTAFLNPTDNPQEQGYQLNQSIDRRSAPARRPAAADQGAPRHELDFLPEHHTDFIFSVVGEAYGFVGARSSCRSTLCLIWRACGS